MKRGSTVSDTTALNGNDIDAVAASLIEGPPQEDENTDEELVQAEADAEDQSDADEAEAEQADADEDEGEDESEADVDEEEPAEQLFTVKVDGRDQQVPLSELLRGYSGQAYIQQGMKQVATARQEVEQVYSALQSERQQIAQFMQAAQTGQLPMQPPKAPDQAMLKTDPIGYLEARVQYDNDLAAYQQTQAALQELSARQEQADERTRMAYLAEQHQLLAQAIPAFAKPETAAQIKQELLAAGTEAYGYTQEELRGVTDYRALRVLHDAAQYRRLMAGKAVAPAPAQRQQTPTIKPGVKPQPQQGKARQAEKAKAQMKRTGSVDDVARFLLM
jgi:hypothetical protein